MLSDEITTKLTGRYIPFEVYTLDFSEYLKMKRFHKQEINADMAAEFDEYILNGGFPKALEFSDALKLSSAEDAFHHQGDRREEENT